MNERAASNFTQRLADLDTSNLSKEHADIVASLNSSSEPFPKEAADFLPCDLQKALQLRSIRQTHHLDGPRMHTVTYVLMPGVDPAAVETSITQEEWSWWKNGKISQWQQTSDGGCSFVLAPVYPFVPSKVGIELEPRATREYRTPWGANVPITSIAARFFADFEGPGCYEILALDGGSALRSKWEGVARLGFKKLMPLSMILNMHLGAEAGTVGFPFPKGTGFPGLVKKLVQN